jgi:hypothetical protein
LDCFGFFSSIIDLTGFVFFFFFFQWFHKKHNTALFDALEKVKTGTIMICYLFVFMSSSF